MAEMRRLAILAAAAIVLAVLPARAGLETSTGLELTPPYEQTRLVATGFSRSSPTCRFPRPPYTTLQARPNARQGLLNLSIGEAVRGSCAPAGYSVETTWKLGRPNSALGTTGLPVMVSLELHITQFRAVETGPGMRSARISLQIRGDEPTEYQTLWLVSCTRRCTRLTPQGELLTVTQRFDRAPATLFLDARAAATASGTASVGMLLRSEVQRATITVTTAS